jgi:HD superfamily phosphodiesterase
MTAAARSTVRAQRDELATLGVPEHAGSVLAVADAQSAREMAESHLGDQLPRRWRHVQAVASRASWVADRRSLSVDLVIAAWLHDIGYAHELAETDLHSLDGARYLRRQGIDERVVSLMGEAFASARRKGTAKTRSGTQRARRKGKAS